MVRKEKKLESQQLTVDRVGLARILHRSPLTVARQMSSARGELPPHVIGTKPRIWRVEAINQWLRDREQSVGACHMPASGEGPVANAQIAPLKRKVGRPRKITIQIKHQTEKNYRSAVGMALTIKKEAPSHY